MVTRCEYKHEDFLSKVLGINLKERAVSRRLEECMLPCYDCAIKNVFIVVR